MALAKLFGGRLLMTSVGEVSHIFKVGPKGKLMVVLVVTCFIYVLTSMLPKVRSPQGEWHPFRRSRPCTIEFACSDDVAFTHAASYVIRKLA